MIDDPLADAVCARLNEIEVRQNEHTNALLGRWLAEGGLLVVTDLAEGQLVELFQQD